MATNQQQNQKWYDRWSNKAPTWVLPTAIAVIALFVAFSLGRVGNHSGHKTISLKNSDEYGHTTTTVVDSSANNGTDNGAANDGTDNGAAANNGGDTQSVGEGLRFSPGGAYVPNL